MEENRCVDNRLFDTSGSLMLRTSDRPRIIANHDRKLSLNLYFCLQTSYSLCAAVK